MNGTNGAALQAVIDRVRKNLPSAIDRSYFEAFVVRHKEAIQFVLDTQLTEKRATPLDAPPDEWTIGRRTLANLAAMEVAASKHPEQMTDQDRRTLMGYSGWGGLSIEQNVHKFPVGFPVPEDAGLIHEYYTPTKVCSEVARLVRPLLPGLSGDSGAVVALEPSAGIGRFVQACSGPGFETIRWLVVEASELSGRMLSAIRSDLSVYIGPFERWVREIGEDYSGKLQLVVANPPYGTRGASWTEDPVRGYREKRAWAYFLRRGLDLLTGGGLGVYLIPSGFLSGSHDQNRLLREKVLRRHHLSSAYRLPSKLFPGVGFVVIDVLFFRSRGGSMESVSAEDQFILDGRYFEEFPQHILGVESGKVGTGEGSGVVAEGRYYQVDGVFTSLPDLVERPFCTSCVIAPVEAPRKRRPRGGVSRVVTEEKRELSPDLELAVALGMRVDAYLSQMNADDTDAMARSWFELHEALESWVAQYGNPHAHLALKRLVQDEDIGAGRFLAAFERSGDLIPGMRERPVVRVRFMGSPDDVVAQARILYRTARGLTIESLLQSHQAFGGTLDQDEVVRRMTAAGWCLDGEQWDEFVPAEHYYTGSLWPKVDRARSRMDQGDETASRQNRKLLDTLGSVTLDEVQELTPQAAWIPLDIVARWLTEEVGHDRDGENVIALERVDGLVVPAGMRYEDLTNHGSREYGVFENVALAIGWINHDRTVFSPPRRSRNEKSDEVRERLAKEWGQSFRGWLKANPEFEERTTQAYNRTVRGFVMPTYPPEPLDIGRWTKTGKFAHPHPHQLSGARRVLDNRGGLIAFDVGVGKTLTALLVIAKARQDGWCRRPVILVPNSIVWKWKKDILDALPDYRVGIIGSRKHVMTRGPRKGLVTSALDTPQERAEKWTRFQSGEYDVVLLTYTALGRTRMNVSAIREYAEATAAIQREIVLRQRNAKDAKKLTERQAAILKEGAAAFIAEVLEIPETWEYDPGIAWDDIGIDMLVVDEAQNYKNLYLPSPREGGIPRYMGGGGEGSDQAWQLDFRAAAVRRRTNGSGVVLLSATPAKNSPLEFYNLIQYVDHDAWTNVGITDPEQFIDYYMKLQVKDCLNSKMEVQPRSAAIGFINLDDLRDVIFRYGEFRTSEEVGLKIPEATRELVEVDMDPEQEAKYADYVDQIEDALGDRSQAGKILGLMARMALVAVHSQLDEGYDWKQLQQDTGIDPHSPKFDAAASRIVANQTCGHIVFSDTLASHVWMRRVLIEAGIPAERIAIINRETTKNPADRTRVADDFNGNEEEGIAPKYDVVIANKIAYEGIDLQRRTCAIHHLDLPWEPATLQQRNGRGVRQGNVLGAIAIYYYFAKRSQDGLRFDLIKGKLGWMNDLIRSTARATNNPGAQMEMGPEEILLLISRDPEKTRQRLEEVKEKRRQEELARIQTSARVGLTAVNTRFRHAERVEDQQQANTLRLQAEEKLLEVLSTPTEAWPWASFATVVRTRPVITSKSGAPFFRGLRIRVPSQWEPEKFDYLEFGEIVGAEIGIRESGSGKWEGGSMERLDGLEVEPDQYQPAEWPGDDDQQTWTDLQDNRLRWSYYKHTDLGWGLAPSEWKDRWWPRLQPIVLRNLQQVGYGGEAGQKIPIETTSGSGLQIVTHRLLSAGRMIPPTDSGWTRFLELAQASAMRWSELNECAEWWWDRKFPRGVLQTEKTGTMFGGER